MFLSNRRERFLDSDLVYDILVAINNYENQAKKSRLDGDVAAALMHEHDADVLKSVFYKGIRAKMIWDKEIERIRKQNKE